MDKIVDHIIEASAGFIIVVILAIPVGIIAGIIQRKKDRFYTSLAQKYNLEYLDDQQIDLMRGFRSRLFKYERTIKTRGVFGGKHNDHSFYIFTKTFYAQRASKVFTIGSCDFGTTEFPHILLKSKSMPLYQDKKGDDRKISIEKTYLKNFDLYCPEDYEIETLQIFTEHLLHSVQTISEQFSIELGGNRMYIYINKDIQKAEHEDDVGMMIHIIKEVIDKTDGLMHRLKDDFEVLDEHFVCSQEKRGDTVADVRSLKDV